MKKMECILLMGLCLCLFTGCNSEKTSEQNENDLYLDGRTEIHYTARDLSGDYENGTEVSLSESYVITEEGTYIFTGTLDDGQIIVDADDNAKVQIVLNGVSITSKNGPGVYVKSADKVFLTLAPDTDNYVQDASVYDTALIAEDEPWGAIFSKDDLTINGSGSLIVKGNYLHGIVSKDSLKITGGIIDVNAMEDGMRGKDEISIHDGEISVTCAEDGLKSNNDEDEDRGNISIDGGSVSIEGTASQGIDAYNVVQVLGGKVSIHTENEGIQGKHIYIEDGEVTIDAVDDCLNAKDSLIEDTEVNHENALLEIAGGKNILLTSAGDGLDSNGSILVSGGETMVHGSSGGVEVSMDYNGTGTITGGVVLATGSSGMAQNFDESSTQCSLMYDCNGNAGSNISLSDSDGTDFVAFEAINSFSSIIISTPDLQVGETYMLSVDETETSVKLQNIITNYSGFMGGFGGPGGPGGHRGLGEPEGPGAPGMW